jgi:hypothetical protein
MRAIPSKGRNGPQKHQCCFQKIQEQSLHLRILYIGEPYVITPVITLVTATRIVLALATLVA